MDFSLESFADAFRHADYRIKHEKFSAFAFILATPADRNVFPELLVHLRELHLLTGEYILVIAPHIEMNKARGLPMNADEVSRVLSTKRFYNHYTGQYVDVSRKIEDFLQQQTEQTYNFARFIGLDVNEIPCVVFFDTLQSPDRYVRWSLQGTSASDVIRDFRNIVAAIESAKAESDIINALDIIANLDRERFAVKVLKELGKAITLVMSFIAR